MSWQFTKLLKRQRFVGYHKRFCCPNSQPSNGFSGIFLRCLVLCAPIFRTISPSTLAPPTPDLRFAARASFSTNRPVVAIRTEGGPNAKKTILAVGMSAKQMLGKTPGNITAIRPMKDGVIADFTVTEQMLKQFIKKVPRHPPVLPSPRIIICVPCGSTQVERVARSANRPSAPAPAMFT